MRASQYLLIIFVSFAISCTEKENPYRREMDGLLHENKLLNEAFQQSGDAQNKMTYVANELQGENEKLEAESNRLRQQVEELSAKNDELSVQLGVITEREREANAKIRAIEARKEEATRQEKQKRQQTLTAIAAANQPAQQPPFRVFDVMFVGKKELSRGVIDAGRMSIRNYTDQNLKIMIKGSPFNEHIQIPPNSTSNAIYVSARKGKEISIIGANHTENITW